MLFISIISHVTCHDYFQYFFEIVDACQPFSSILCLYTEDIFCSHCQRYAIVTSHNWRVTVNASGYCVTCLKLRHRQDKANFFRQRIWVFLIMSDIRRQTRVKKCHKNEINRRKRAHKPLKFITLLRHDVYKKYIKIYVWNYHIKSGNTFMIFRLLILSIKLLYIRFVSRQRRILRNFLLFFSNVF